MSTGQYLTAYCIFKYHPKTNSLSSIWTVQFALCIVLWQGLISVPLVSISLPFSARRCQLAVTVYLKTGCISILLSIYGSKMFFDPSEGKTLHTLSSWWLFLFFPLFYSPLLHIELNSSTGMDTSWLGRALLPLLIFEYILHTSSKLIRGLSCL